MTKLVQVGVRDVDFRWTGEGMFGASRTFLSASALSHSINRSGPWEEYYADAHIYTEKTLTSKIKLIW